MVNGIRPISPKRALLICEGSGWKVTPHELLPNVYPNPTDGLPAAIKPDQLANSPVAFTVAIRPPLKRFLTPFTGGGYIYSTREFERRMHERREDERRNAERRDLERRS